MEEITCYIGQRPAADSEASSSRLRFIQGIEGHVCLHTIAGAIQLQSESTHINGIYKYIVALTPPSFSCLALHSHED